MSEQEDRYSLLDDQLFEVSAEHGGAAATTQMSLPQLLAMLDDEDVHIHQFGGLQAHQHQSWFCFLVQLGALGRARSGVPERGSPARWREALLALSGEDEGAWCLVQDVLDKPGFMQAPLTEGSLKAAKFEGKVVATPDMLDVLVLSKNHDIKASRMQNPEPEHWIYALISLQTQGGYSGRDNYGIVRMNGGSASRPFVGLAPGLDWGARWRRDVACAVETRTARIQKLGLSAQGVALVWCLPWNGEPAMALSLEACDPLFLEICRRIRFVGTLNGLICLKSSTTSARIGGSSELKGNTQDVWTPMLVEKDGIKSLTISGNGFSYDVVRKLISHEDLIPSPAQRYGDADTRKPMLFWAHGLTRGQGITEGLHQRILLIPGKVLGRLRPDEERAKLAKRAKLQAELTGNIRRKALYAALRVLYAGGATDEERPIDEHWMRRYEQDADARFFVHLFEHMDKEEIESNLLWFKLMRSCAYTLLMEATHAAPIPSAKRWRAIAIAESMFHSSFYRHPELSIYVQTERPDEEVTDVVQ
jgi:CRISPR system Cascade subunit CasA